MGNAWDRQPAESAPAWEAFQTYRDMGLGRSIEKVSQVRQKNGRRSGLRRLEFWSSQHAWKARAAAWDEHADRERQEAALEAEATLASAWVGRREEHRQRMWGLALEALERLETMLRWPLSEQTLSDDGHTTVIMPAKWTFASAARLMAEADRAARLAIDPEGAKPMLVTISNAEAAELGRQYGKTAEDVQREIAEIAARLGAR